MALFPYSHGGCKFSSREWTTNIIAHNKFVKFWFWSAIYFDSIYVHVALTLLGGCNAVMHSMFVGMEDVPNLQTWHRFVIFCSYLSIPCYGAVNSISCLRRNLVFRHFELQAHFISNSLTSDVNFSVVQKLLLVAGAFQCWCIVMTTWFTFLNFGVFLDVHVLLIVEHVVYVVFYFYLQTTVAHFCISISMIGQCMLRMRHILNTYQNLDTPPDNVLGKFVSHYDSLIEVCDGISKHFGPQNLFIVVHFLANLVFEAYFLIWSFDNNPWGMYSKSNVFFVSLAQIAFLGLVIGAGSLLIVSCTINESEADKFNDALASLCVRDQTGTLVKNPYMTAHFAIGKKLKFSACGCFNIDYRLGYSMLAACITYLVVLVEFDNKNNEEPPIISTTSLPACTSSY